MTTIIVNTQERVVSDHEELTYERIVSLSGRSPRTDYTVTALNSAPGGDIVCSVMPGQSMGRAGDRAGRWIFSVALTNNA